MSEFTEESIAKYINSKLYKDMHITMLNNTYWPGHESDMLVITRDMKAIEIEIKISKQDFKADRLKKKWSGFTVHKHSKSKVKNKIWKHYFCMPSHLYSKDILEFLPNPNCGVILLKMHKCGTITHHFVKNAKAFKNCSLLSKRDVYNVARLVNLRYWNKLEVA